MDELRIAREKIKDLESKQKKDEKTVKTQFDHMMKLQDKCRDLKASAIGGDGIGKTALAPGEGDREKQIEELKDKLLTAEKNKEILMKASETDSKTMRMTKARYELQLKELNLKIEKLEGELREKTQESKIASSKIRELQSSGNGLPAKRESVTLKPIKNPTERSLGRLPSVGGTNEQRNSKASYGKTQPSSPTIKKDNPGSKSALAALP